MEFVQIMSHPRIIRARIIEEATPILLNFLVQKNLGPLLTVRCRPQPHCERKCCFANVDKQVALKGGELITGWFFNEIENMSITGEAHAIWKHPNGKRIDITPHDFHPERIVFVPDPKVALKRGYTASPLLILSDDPEVIALETFRADCELLREQKFKGFGQYIEVTTDEVRELAAKSNLPFDRAKELMFQTMNMDQ